jgi:hypothetical protein
MSLIRKSEFLFLSKVIVLRVLFKSLFAWSFLFALNFCGLNLLGKMVMLCEQFVSIYSSNHVDRNVGCLVLKPSVDIDIRVNEPACMSESLKRVELVPF